MGLAARAKAYRSPVVRSGGGISAAAQLCARYENELDSRESAPRTGTFTFNIRDDVDAYAAQYCNGEYLPRFVDRNPNIAGAPVSESPIYMGRRSQLSVR